MSRHLSRVAGLAVAALVLAGAAWAQTITGRISGTVYDTSRSVLPGVTVSVTETRTGFTQNAVSDANGAFVFVSLPLGDYTVSAELEGFKKAVKSGFVLGADERLTADFLLEVGTFAETVEVSVAAETVNTTSGELSRKVDQAQVQNLALNGRNYLQLTTLIPGVPLLNDSALDIMTGLGINTSINGSRQNANLLTVDGGFNMDSGSNNSQISNVSVDSIQEVSVKTSNFSAEYGRNSGAAINIVTRGGTNKFKGSAYEYARREQWDANDPFASARGVAKPELKYDDFGGTLGGPIMKDKLFFFGGVEWKKIRRFTSPTNRTLPTSAQRSGDFSMISTRIIDPLTGQQFPGNVIPADRITADGKAIANVYAAMAKQAASYEDVVRSNNALFMDPNPFDFRQENLRVDYQLTQAQRMTFRLLLDHYNLIEPGGTFISSQLPTVPTNRQRPGRNIQVNHFWTLTPSIVNEAKFNYSGNGQVIPPVGDTWKRETYGFQFPQLYAGGGTYENSIPNVDISGFATFRGANASLISPTWDYSFSDIMTWMKGPHTIKGGVLVIYNQKNQNGRSEYPGYVNFATSGNSRTTGNAFADALLSNFRTYREAQLDPMGYFRFWQYEGFVSDAWRLSRKLSVEVGLRYAWQEPTYTLGNNTTSFDPALYNPAQAVVVNTNGTLVAGTGNRYNGLTRPGDVPSDQVANVPNAGSPAVQAIPFAKNPGYYKNANLFAPRFSFAWSPFDDGRTSIRGGVGLFYDRPEGNLYFPLVNNPPFALSSEYQNGNLSNPGGGTAAALAPWGTIDSLDPNLTIPRVWNYSIGVQRELPWWSLFGEIAYVGNDGQHLIRQPDINQASFDDLNKNAALPPSQQVSTNYLRPFKGYTAINYRLSDADSTYNSLQLYVGRRRGDLTFTLNYTYSKAYDNASSNTENPEDYANKSYSWGPSSNDRPHIFVGTWTYRLPFFKNDKGLTRAVLGGWEVSGITRFQSGAPLTVTGTTSIGGRRADYIDGTDPYVSEEQRNTLVPGSIMWLNPAAFAVAPDGRRGNSTRGQFRGPGYAMWDISLRKQIPIKGSIKAQLQVDLFNAFNQVNYRSPGTNLSSAGFGSMTSAAPPRNVQIGFRVNF
jgi:hypothetical protein